jgi:hypothetical protein
MPIATKCVISATGILLKMVTKFDNRPDFFLWQTAKNKLFGANIG